MRLIQYIILSILFTACGTTLADKKNAVVCSEKTENTTKSQATLAIKDDRDAVTIDSDYATYFVVITDTSVNYSFLHSKMFSLNRKLDIPIDTMGRYYNKTKNLIALPENDADEMYAGEYYPRRFPSEFLSLEYLNFYQKNSGDKTIALVAGIFDSEKRADSILNVLHRTEKNVFKIKAAIYVGCMH